MKKPATNRFLLSGRISYRSLKLGLREMWKLRGHAEVVEESTFLDTFDWRLYSAGTVLEAIHEHDGWRLIWRNLNETTSRDSCALTGLPRFAAEIDNPAVRKRLAQVIGVRALLPLVRLRGRRRSLQLLDVEDKNLLTLQLEKDADLVCLRQGGGEVAIPRPSPTRVKLLPMRGYTEAAESVRAALLALGSLRSVERDPWYDNLELCGIDPNGPRSSAERPAPHTHSGAAIKQIQLRHFEKLKLQEEGIRQDIDTEFLHDFRVAVRRTRALLRQSRGVFHARHLVRFKRAFAWLGRSSGVARDLDVHLHALEQARTTLPFAMQEAMAPIREQLRKDRDHEYQRLHKVLGSRRYRDLCHDWQALLLGPDEAHAKLAHARQPIIEFAGRRIWKAYRKARRQGLRLDGYRDSARLHRLRKTVKKLRYLIESFHHLYPQRAMRPLIDRLRSLQENLGLLQDCQVQRRKFEEIQRNLPAQTGALTTTHAVLRHLVASLRSEDTELRRHFAAAFNEFSTTETRAHFRALAHH
jgi:CHAD domain-containing protein